MNIKYLLVFFMGHGIVFGMDKPPAKTQPTSKLIDIAFDFFEYSQFEKLLDQGYPLTLSDFGALALRTIEHKSYMLWATRGVMLLISGNLVDERVSSLKSKAAQAAQSQIGQKKYYLLPAELRYSVLSNNFDKTWDEFKKLFSFADGSQNISDIKMREIIEKKKMEQAAQLWDAINEYQSIPFALKIIRQLRKSFAQAKRPEHPLIKLWQQQLVARICKQVITITGYLKQKGFLDTLIAEIEKTYDKEIRGLRSISTNTIQLEQLKRMILGLLKADEQTCPIYITEQVLELTKP